MADYYCLPFSTHPLRDELYDELHARPFRPVSTPQQISHLAFKGTPDELDGVFSLLGDLCRRYSAVPPGEGAVSFEQVLGEFTLCWERHMEFYSLTFMRAAAPVDEPFLHPVLELLPPDWLAALPGQAVAALHIVVGGEELDIDQDSLMRCFEGQRMILSQPKEGKALLCTAFKLHSDGFGRFLIQNRGIPDYQMGRLVQRVYEIETYRLLAQLSIPLAKRLAPELSAMDRDLARMLANVPRQDGIAGERELLDRLSRLSTRLEAWRAETNYRFSATRAYHELVESRLTNIREEEVEGHMTLAEFMARRLRPGLRTCEAVQNWMEDLSRRIERAGDMLRTRVNITLQEQNKGLLATMNRRSHLQFRFQETVEGLSVAAVSYYLVGLLSYVISGLPLEALHLDKKAALAFTVPLVVVAVWWVIRRIKHRLINRLQDRG